MMAQRAKACLSTSLSPSVSAEFARRLHRSNSICSALRRYLHLRGVCWSSLPFVCLFLARRSGMAIVLGAPLRRLLSVWLVLTPPDTVHSPPKRPTRASTRTHNRTYSRSMNYRARSSALQTTLLREVLECCPQGARSRFAASFSLRYPSKLHTTGRRNNYSFGSTMLAASLQSNCRSGLRLSLTSLSLC